MTPTQKVAIGAKIVRARLTGRPRPFFVQYSLLNACDVRCGYCAYPARHQERLTVAQHRSVIQQFARLGAIRIKFIGGEPLLYKGLEELVDEIGRCSMRSAIVTNGLTIPEKIDVVRRIDEIAISIDGREVAHDRQRGAGTWRRVMASIRACAEHNLDYFLTVVVTSQSAGEVDWLLDLARDLRVNVNFQLCQIYEPLFGAGARDWALSADEARTVIRRIIAAKEAGAPVLFTTRSYRKTLEWDDFSVDRIERPGEPTRCTAGTYFLHMDPNGDLYPCFLHVDHFAPKNVVRDGVEAAWRHTQRHNCHGCFNTWLNENRAIFDLQPAVFMNFGRNYMRQRRHA